LGVRAIGCEVGDAMVLDPNEDALAHLVLSAQILIDPDLHDALVSQLWFSIVASAPPT
jgi:hypothetical protein